MRTLLTLLLLTVIGLGCETVDPTQYDENDQAIWSEEDSMGSPLFVKTPIVNSGFATTYQLLGPDAQLDLYVATAPTLIERVLWATHAAGAIANGTIMLAVIKPGVASVFNVKYEAVPAADPAPLATLFLSGDIRLDLVLDTGWTLVAMHTIEDPMGGSVALAFTAQGGELE